MKDTYLTIETPSIGEYKEKGSKFIAYTFPVYSEEEVKECLEVVKKEHFKARHYCYAYRIGLDGKRFRANDDGEPSGTAGRPILGQIDSFGLANVLSIVVRYFGGTKLGTSGLKRAYKESTKDAFQQAQIVEKIIEDQFHVVFDYVATSDVMNFIKNEGFKILKASYENKTTLLMTIRQSDVKRFKETLEKIIGVKVNQL
ncbi:MAG: FIG000605: protein co-occurring with transport systems (COG1739) [uncultured Aureispira sp.]|uniref:FIG000605: protein co-occurring with transport systems (COG1739) n=1 Tax=uncultured Aureispira sp. TaxID=1331704 RepID=A0A6S6U8B1_9BACT|nr:MAG: FIG000605: protein co-occurring with transport systems (COG1739) [uncultured Aureispira sp.]